MHMSIPTRRSLRRALATAAAAITIVLPTLVVAQPVDNSDSVRLNRRLKMLLTTADNIGGLRGIRFSNISIYKLSDELTSRLRRFLSKDDAGDSTQVCAIINGLLDDELPCPEVFGHLNAAVGPRDPRRFADQIRDQLAKRLGFQDKDDIPIEDFTAIIATFQSLKNRAGQRPSEFYLVASRNTERPRLIGLLGFKSADGNLTLAGQQFVWVGNDLYGWLASNQEYNGMYSDMAEAITERNTQVLKNVTYQFRDLDDIEIVRRTSARATYIDEGTYDWVLTRISEGSPLRKKADTSTTDQPDFNTDDFTDASGSTFAKAETPGTGEFPYELAIGSDILASFRAYELRNGNQPIPKWGVEVRSNFDEINYPSIWGGRTTVSAVLENVRIGVVLPAFRFGETIAESGIGSTPQNIIGGYGAAMSGDFAFPLLDNSGLFNFYASYTFSEAQTTSVGPQSDQFSIDPDDSSVTFALNPQTGENAYLVRYAAIGFYSFGFFADKDANHLFRVKLGGGAYGIDTFKRSLDTSDTELFRQGLQTDGPEGVPDTLRTLYQASASVESRGGVGARIEYMRAGTKYPFGAGVQYFDGSLLGNIWLQFTIGQQLDLKLEGKYFTPLFRTARLWENENLVVPTVTFKYHFGALPVDPAASGF